MNLNVTMKKLQLERLKMWGEVTHAPYGKISIGTVRGGKGRICNVWKNGRR